MANLQPPRPPLPQPRSLDPPFVSAERPSGTPTALTRAPRPPAQDSQDRRPTVPTYPGLRAFDRSTLAIVMLVKYNGMYIANIFDGRR